VPFHYTIKVRNWFQSLPLKWVNLCCYVVIHMPGQSAFALVGLCKLTPVDP
jgi:hypothetical protein